MCEEDSREGASVRERLVGLREGPNSKDLGRVGRWLLKHGTRPRPILGFPCMDVRCSGKLACTSRLAVRDNHPQLAHH